MPFGRMTFGKKKGAIKGMYYPGRFSTNHILGSKLRMRFKKPVGLPKLPGPSTNIGLGRP